MIVYSDDFTAANNTLLTDHKDWVRTSWGNYSAARIQNNRAVASGTSNAWSANVLPNITVNDYLVTTEIVYMGSDPTQYREGLLLRSNTEDDFWRLSLFRTASGLTCNLLGYGTHSGGGGGTSSTVIPMISVGESITLKALIEGDKIKVWLNDTVITEPVTNSEEWTITKGMTGFPGIMPVGYASNFGYAFESITVDDLFVGGNPVSIFCPTLNCVFVSDTLGVVRALDASTFQSIKEFNFGEIINKGIYSPYSDKIYLCEAQGSTIYAINPKKLSINEIAKSEVISDFLIVSGKKKVAYSTREGNIVYLK